MARGIAKDSYDEHGGPVRHPWGEQSDDLMRRYEALIQVGDGSQWTITVSSMRELKNKAHDIVGKDLVHERYYVRHVYVNGSFDDNATQELQAILRS